MKRVIVPCAAALAIAGAVGFAFHNVASADCIGLDVLRVCYTPNPGWTPAVDPTGAPIEECVHTGPTCTPVSIPFPSASLGSGAPVQEIRCYNYDEICGDPK